MFSVWILTVSVAARSEA